MLLAAKESRLFCQYYQLQSDWSLSKFNLFYNFFSVP